MGFIIADRIARSMGLAVDSPKRIEGALIYALESFTHEQGHCYATRAMLLDRARNLLKTFEFEPRAEELAPVLNDAVARKVILRDLLPRERVLSDDHQAAPFLEAPGVTVEYTADDDAASAAATDASAASATAADTKAAESKAAQTVEALYMPAMHACERGVALGLVNLLHSSSQQQLHVERKLTPAAVRGWLDAFQTRTNTELSAQQRLAVETAVLQGVCIITGGPGCG